jgi:hypothetical protein
MFAGQQHPARLHVYAVVPPLRWRELRIDPGWMANKDFIVSDRLWIALMRVSAGQDRYRFCASGRANAM